jgi:hypothetical protein
VIYWDRTPHAGRVIFLSETHSVLLDVTIWIQARRSSRPRQHCSIRCRGFLPRASALVIVQDALVVELGLTTTMWQSSWIADAFVTSKPYTRAILPTAPTVRAGQEETETANAEAPALWHERIEDGKGGSSDGKEDVDRRPVNDPHRPGNVQRLMVLRYLPHDAADAGDGTDGEEEADAKFFARRHLDFIE